MLDDFVDMEFGTGAVKITPAHDPNDFDVGKRHKLPSVTIFSDDGYILEGYGPFTVSTGLCASIILLFYKWEVVKKESKRIISHLSTVCKMYVSTVHKNNSL